MKLVWGLALAVVLSACSSDESSGGTAGQGGQAGQAGAGGAAGSAGTGGTAGSAGTGGAPCRLGLTWQLVDDFIDASNEESRAADVAADASAVYVTGTSGTRWLMRKSSDAGATWSTIADFGAGNGAKLAIDASGVVYVSGSAGTHQVVRRSESGAATWNIVDDFGYEAGFDTYAGHIAIGAEGVVYSVAQAGSAAGPRWLVRKSSQNGGAPWTTDLDFQYEAGKVCVPRGLAVDGAQNVYVVGRCEDASSIGHWIVRRRTPDGSWTTIDDLSGAQANGVYASDRVLVAGQSTVGTVSTWVVRRAEGDGSFTEIDNFTATAAAAGVPHVDPSGAITVVGQDTLATIPHWLTRRSTDDGVSWQTIDDFSYENGVYRAGIGADPAGNLYAAAAGIDAQDKTRWLVRKMSCAE